MAVERESTSKEPVKAANPLAEDPELLGDFILESREHLTSIELQLLALDQDPGHHAGGCHGRSGSSRFADVGERSFH